MTKIFLIGYEHRRFANSFEIQTQVTAHAVPSALSPPCNAVCGAQVRSLNENRDWPPKARGRTYECPECASRLTGPGGAPAPNPRVWQTDSGASDGSASY